MFKQMSNTTFNNGVFSRPKIERMHPSAERLYQVAAQQKPPIVGQSAVAKWLNESPQVVKNWESRGVSQRGALKLAQVSDVVAGWVLTGEGAAPSLKPVGAPSPAVSLPPEYRQLLIDLEDLLPRERSKWIDSIHQAAEYAREIREHAKKAQPSAVAHALREKPRASASAKYGDGNERQQALPLAVVQDPFTAPPSERESHLYDAFKRAPK
ncbi:MAG: hypothetical protein LCH79_15400 [Proteobacteria bacterium]|nr:hypothetical protein [Pseudomonadota bacterium]